MYHDFRLLIEHDCYIQMTHLEQRLSSNTHVLLRNVLFSFQVGNNFDLLTRDIAMRNGVKNSTYRKTGIRSRPLIIAALN